MKKILKEMIDVYNEKMSNVTKNCYATPQIAVQFFIWYFWKIFEVEVNNKETVKCFEYDWQSEIMHSHAEYKILEINKNEIEKMEENSISILITSHPCDNCINFLNEFESQIKNIFYINNYATTNKINAYEARNKKPKKYKDININFQQYNPKKVNDISGYSERIKKMLYDDVKKYCLEFIKEEFFEFDNGGKRYLILNKDDIRRQMHKIKVFEDFTKIRIMSFKRNSVFIDLVRINKWFSSQT